MYVETGLIQEIKGVLVAQPKAKSPEHPRQASMAHFQDSMQRAVDWNVTE